jgi:alpha-galactosidase
MEETYRVLATESAPIWDGTSKTLLQLGYKDAGLDDCYQLCGSYGPEKFTYHNPDKKFWPEIDPAKFTNMTAMTAVAHTLGLTAGWYANNCACGDHCKDPACFAADVDFFVSSGFDSIKLDGCGKEENVQLWRDMLNFSSPKPILIENCHNGPNTPHRDAKGDLWCPFHQFRSSTDIRPVHGSILANLQSIPPLADANLSVPGCWAYPDMLEVGVTNTQDPTQRQLNHSESRSHFGAWAIVSAPLILGLNLSDTPTLRSVWDIITNTEAIAVNQQYAGFSGTIFFSSAATTAFAPCGWWLPNCTFPSQQYLYKPLPGGDIAVLLMNNAVAAADLVLPLHTIPGWSGGGAAVRDIWAHATNPPVRGTLEAHVGPRDSAFFRLTPQA